MQDLETGLNRDGRLLRSEGHSSRTPSRLGALALLVVFVGISVSVAVMLGSEQRQPASLETAKKGSLERGDPALEGQTAGHRNTMNTMADPDPIVEIVEETEAWPLYPGEEEDFPGWEVKLREAQKQTHGKQKDANPTHSQTSVPPQYPAFDPDDSASGRESISGRVLDEVGRAVPGTAVTARLSRRYDLDLSVGGEFDQQETQADEEGHYAFRGLEEGEYEVRTAESRGYAEASIVTRTGVSSADLIVISQRRVWVYGAVENSRGEPLARVRVASLGQPPDEGTTDTDENGSYGLSLIVKGRNVPTRVHYYQEGYRLRSVSFTGAQFSREEDSLVVNVTLRPVAYSAVEGEITNESGSPVAGQVVMLSSNGARRYYGLSDAQGRFLIKDVEPAEGFQVSVHPNQPYQDYSAGPIRLKPGTRLGVSIVLESLNQGVLSGQVRDVSGQPIPRYMLVARSMNAFDRPFLVLSDEQGYFQAEGVPYGPFRVETSTSPTFILTGNLTEATAEAGFDLVLDLGAHRIEGRVVDPRGSIVPSAPVRLYWSHSSAGVSSQSVRGTLTDASGHFRFAGVGPGAHALQVNAPGFQPSDLDYHAGEDPSVLTVRLEQAPEI